MRSPLNIDDFDNYLEEEVSQHRMYPSDHVWRNIQQELHGYRKWPALTVITLFVISALVVGTLLMKPHKLDVTIAAANASKTVNSPVEKIDSPRENLQQHLSPEHITQQTIAAVTEGVDIDEALKNAFAQYHNIPGLPPADNVNDNTLPVIAATNNSSGTVSAVPQKISSNSVNNPLIGKTNSAIAPQAGSPINAGLKKQADALAESYYGFNWMKSWAFDSKLPNRFYYTRGIWKTVYGSILFSSARNLHSTGPADYNNVNFSNVTTSKESKNKVKVAKASRFDLQLYATPSIAYRTVSYGKSAQKGQLSGIPYGEGYIVTMKGLVVNRPVAGYEAGVAVGYKLTNNVSLRAGLQFNERGYDIEGSIPNPVRNTTLSSTPDLNSSNSLSSLDISAQNAANDNKQPAPIVFTNRYYQVSMPIGIDWKVWRIGKFSLNVATSLAPSYTFSKAPFIVASNNKSLNGGSELMRKWNINSALETYIAYTTGKFKLQLGPQVRYQLLSTLNGSYPVKEHLIDYGIKIGVTRSLP